MEVATIVIRTSHRDLRVSSVYVRSQSILHHEDLLALLLPDVEGIIVENLNAKSPAGTA